MKPVHIVSAASSPVLGGPYRLEKQSHSADRCLTRPASLWLECNQNYGKHNEKFADSSADDNGKLRETLEKMVARRERTAVALVA
jgi:hypothetical protein